MARFLLVRLLHPWQEVSFYSHRLLVPHPRLKYVNCLLLSVCVSLFNLNLNLNLNVNLFTFYILYIHVYSLQLISECHLLHLQLENTLFFGDKGHKFLNIFYVISNCCSPVSHYFSYCSLDILFWTFFKVI
jgi:hypothetical protein